MTGLIVKALSGFYYVDCGGELIRCQPRGKFRYEKVTPLVGDRVEITPTEPGKGRLDQILPRKNQFQRPAVANMDQMIIIAAQVIPVTDPFLIDRVAAIAELQACEPILVINKCDLDAGDALYHCYQSTGIRTLRVSAETGEGIDALRDCLKGKVSVFTGNSGVGKSSILNTLDARCQIETGEVSKKLGRGRHTTQCRFVGCAHVKEKGCAVCTAVKSGAISKSRHNSYVRLYAAAKEHKAWETK